MTKIDSTLKELGQSDFRKRKNRNLIIMTIMDAQKLVIKLRGAS